MLRGRGGGCCAAPPNLGAELAAAPHKAGRGAAAVTGASGGNAGPDAPANETERVSLARHWNIWI